MILSDSLDLLLCIWMTSWFFSWPLYSHVRSVFHKLHENVFAKIEKCVFGAQDVNFVGYTVSAEGFRRNSAKAHAIRDSVQPKTLKALQSFLRFASTEMICYRSCPGTTRHWTAIHTRGLCLWSWGGSSPVTSPLNGLYHQYLVFTNYNQMIHIILILSIFFYWFI